MGICPVVHIVLYASMIHNLQRLDERGPARDIRRTINKLIDMVISQRPTSAPNVRWRRTAIGAAIEVQPQGGPTDPATGFMRYRGEWNPATSYDEFDVVIVRGGTTGGTFIAVRAVSSTTPPADPPLDPQNGVDWVCLWRGALPVW